MLLCYWPLKMERPGSRMSTRLRTCLPASILSRDSWTNIVQGIIWETLFVYNTLYRIFETFIPRNETARPRSQSLYRRAFSFLGIHKLEPDIYIGFSPALHLQCRHLWSACIISFPAFLCAFPCFLATNFAQRFEGRVGAKQILWIGRLLTDSDILKCVEWRV